MGLFDQAKQKAEEFIRDNPDKVEQISDTVISKAAEAADSMTGGKFSDQIDMAQEKADDALGQH